MNSPPSRHDVTSHIKNERKKPGTSLRTTPVLADHDVVIPQDVRLEAFQDLAAKLAGGEGVRFLLGVVRVRHVGPVGVEAGGPLLVQAVVDGDVVRAGVVEDCLWEGGRGG